MGPSVILFTSTSRWGLFFDSTYRPDQGGPGWRSILLSLGSVLIPASAGASLFFDMINDLFFLARIKAVLRRQTMDRKAGTEKNDLVIQVDDLVLDKAAQAVKVNRKIVELSTTEYKVLSVLMKNPNRVLSRDQIMNMAQGKDFMAFDRSIDIHISKLRSKIEMDPSSPRRIKTIWGTGYMLTGSV